MQHFDAGTFNETHFQQTAFDVAFPALHGQDATDAARPHQSQGLRQTRLHQAAQLE
jgi:hypothetical protein